MHYERFNQCLPTFLTCDPATITEHGDCRAGIVAAAMSWIMFAVDRWHGLQQVIQIYICTYTATITSHTSIITIGIAAQPSI